ncbi:MAG: sugar nucleotide-binding protein [Bdellovibrionota bacterium]
MSSRKGAVPQGDEFRHDSPLRFRRVMIVGASGYLGSALAMGLRDDFDILATYHKSAPLWIEGVHSLRLDCMNGNDILQSVQRYAPDVVIYCAGISSPAMCHENPMIADALNSRAMALFFKVLPRPIPFAYISCDQVFSSAGTDANFRFNEEDDPDPQNEFGQSKMRGESLVLAHNRLTYVMRVARLYGERLGSPQRPRETWIQRHLEQIAKNDTVHALDDQRRTTVYVGDVVRALRRFLFRAPLSSTIFHLGAGDALSEFETATQLCHVWGVDPGLIVTEKLADRVAKQGFNEARFSAISSKRFEDLYAFKFQSYSEGIVELRARLESGYTQAWV